MKIKLLTTTAVAGLMLAGCNLTLPELPKIEKKNTSTELTKEECEKIIKKRDELNEKGWYGNESRFDRNYALDADYCEKKYSFSVDVKNLDKRMKELAN